MVGIFKRPRSQWLRSGLRYSRYCPCNRRLRHPGDRCPFHHAYCNRRECVCATRWISASGPRYDRDRARESDDKSDVLVKRCGRRSGTRFQSQSRTNLIRRRGCGCDVQSHCMATPRLNLPQSPAACLRSALRDCQRRNLRLINVNDPQMVAKNAIPVMTGWLGIPAVMALSGGHWWPSRSQIRPHPQAAMATHCHQSRKSSARAKLCGSSLTFILYDVPYLKIYTSAAARSSHLQKRSRRRQAGATAPTRRPCGRLIYIFKFYALSEP